MGARGLNVQYFQKRRLCSSTGYCRKSVTRDIHRAKYLSLEFTRVKKNAITLTVHIFWVVTRLDSLPPCLAFCDTFSSSFFCRVFLSCSFDISWLFSLAYRHPFSPLNDPWLTSHLHCLVSFLLGLQSLPQSDRFRSLKMGHCGELQSSEKKKPQAIAYQWKNKSVKQDEVEARIKPASRKDLKKKLLVSYFDYEHFKWLVFRWKIILNSPSPTVSEKKIVFKLINFDQKTRKITLK